MVQVAANGGFDEQSGGSTRQASATFAAPAAQPEEPTALDGHAGRTVAEAAMTATISAAGAFPSGVVGGATNR